jgi:hypothetical protein
MRCRNVNMISESLVTEFYIQRNKKNLEVYAIHNFKNSKINNLHRFLRPMYNIT